MANPFEIMVSNLRDLGFFGFLFPWVLMFALTFGLLLKSKALGEDKRVMGVVSMVVAFFVIGFGGPALGTFLTNAFGLATIVLAGILITILFVAMSGYDVTKFADAKVIALVGVAIGLVVFFMALSSIGVKVNLSDPLLSTLFVIIVLGVAVWFIAGGSGGK
jgi:hypothetical protein